MRLSIYQRLATLFVFLGIAFLGIGLLVNMAFEGAIMYGFIMAIFCQIVSFVFGFLWFRSTRKK
jgi:UPF0716 family protein affecting phage T7 exclusion